MMMRLTAGGHENVTSVTNPMTGSESIPRNLDKKTMAEPSRHEIINLLNVIHMNILLGIAAPYVSVVAKLDPSIISIDTGTVYPNLVRE